MGGGLGPADRLASMPLVVVSGIGALDRTSPRPPDRPSQDRIVWVDSGPRPVTPRLVSCTVPPLPVGGMTLRPPAAASCDLIVRPMGREGLTNTGRLTISALGGRTVVTAGFGE